MCRISELAQQQAAEIKKLRKKYTADPNHEISIYSQNSLFFKINNYNNVRGNNDAHNSKFSNQARPFLKNSHTSKYIHYFIYCRFNHISKDIVLLLKKKVTNVVG
jgi:hypothetical protein